MKLKKLGCLLLMFALIAVTFGSTLDVAMADETQAGATGDIWSLIGDLEGDALSGRKGAPAQDGYVVPEPTEEFFASMADEVELAIKEWDGYAVGSLKRNGDVMFWDDINGIGYGYIPSIRADLYNAEQNHSGGPAAQPVVPWDNGGGEFEPIHDYRSNDVALFQPFWGHDPNCTGVEAENYRAQAQDIAYGIGGTAYINAANDATITELAAALTACKVVLVNSHGRTDSAASDPNHSMNSNTSYICLVYSGEDLTETDMADVRGKMVNGRRTWYKHACEVGTINGSFVWGVDGTAIRNHMDQRAPGNFLWMTVCEGMMTDGLCTPLHGNGVEVVFGYSQSVTIKGDDLYELYFWEKMEEGATVRTAADYMKEMYDINDSLGYFDPAFPIFVSTPDPYPGQGAVDDVQEVTSEWTLPLANVQAPETYGWVRGDFNWIPSGTKAGTNRNMTVTASFKYESNRGKVREVMDVEATMTSADDPRSHVYVATVPGEDSPDGDTYISDPNYLPEIHNWVFDGFGASDNNGLPGDICAIYHCDSCGETFEMWSQYFSRTSGYKALFGNNAPLVYQYISDRDSLDNKGHQAVKVYGHSAEEWTFAGFEWKNAGEVSANATYVHNMSDEPDADTALGYLEAMTDADNFELIRNDEGLVLKYKTKAHVDPVASGRPGSVAYSVPKYRAYITAEEAPDGLPNSKTRIIVPGIDPDVRPEPVDHDVIGDPQEKEINDDSLILGEGFIFRPAPIIVRPQ